MFFKLAWKNIWRNKKRTLIVTASLFFAVLLSSVMRSMQIGSYAYMIESSAKLMSGYLQIMGKDYWDSRSLDKSTHFTEEQKQALKKNPHISMFTERFENFALFSTDSITKPAPVIAISPKTENQFTNLKKKVVQGRYLSENDDGLLVAAGLAGRLNIAVGDSLILFGSGYRGVMAVDELPVVGIVKLPFPELNNAMVYMSLNHAQQVFATDGLVTSIPIMLHDIRSIEQVKLQLNDIILANQMVMDWQQMIPEILESVELDQASGLIILLILYVVIAFGVFGTIMIMTAERRKEFGILISVGMSRGQLILVSFIENIFISFMGVVFGFIVSYPIIAHFSLNPIVVTGSAAESWESMGIEPLLNFSNDMEIFISQTIVVLIIALICALYPLIYLLKLKETEAIYR